MKLSKYIDHTLLKPEATQKQIMDLVHIAKEYDFASVCINSCWVNLCANELKDSDVKVCTVIGFPLGANTSEVKVAETIDAIKNGADEIDMVINIGALKSGLEQVVFEDIKMVVDAAKPKIVKVIIETCLLSDEEKIKACQLASKAKAKFVKTSTGFSTGGATVDDVKLMKSHISDDMEVKASGGIKTKEDFKKMIEAGATRIGTSNGVSLI
ncbi:deoxyribose-phosphate aldolase [Bacilli bacterium PM5-9]|nr:deoxyribose-phosphate aldolase [Bacilli bacterium PM5-9]